MRGTLEQIPSGAAGLRVKVARIRQLVEGAKRDPNFRSRVLDRVRDLDERDFGGEVDRVVQFVRDGIRYTRDPHHVELFTEPRLLLEQILTHGQAAGDCDDHVILASAMLETLGHPTRYRVGGDAPGSYRHIWLDVQLAGQWQPIELTRDLPVGYDPSPVFGHTETHLGELGMHTPSIVLRRRARARQAPPSRTAIARSMLYPDEQLGKLKLSKVFKKVIKLPVKMATLPLKSALKLSSVVHSKARGGGGGGAAPEEIPESIVPAAPPPEPMPVAIPSYQAAPTQGPSWSQPHYFTAPAAPWPQSYVQQSPYPEPAPAPPPPTPEPTPFDPWSYYYGSGAYLPQPTSLYGLIPMGRNPVTGEEFFADLGSNIFKKLGKSLKKIVGGVKKPLAAHLKNPAVQGLVSMVPGVGPIAGTALRMFAPSAPPPMQGSPLDLVKQALPTLFPQLPKVLPNMFPTQPPPIFGPPPPGPQEEHSGGFSMDGKTIAILGGAAAVLLVVVMMGRKR